jgi:hypothetical protein
VYDTSDLRVAKLVDSDGNSSVDVTERYVLEDGHVIVQLDGTGTVQHEYMHGPQVDQVFADENALGEVLYPLTDNVGTRVVKKPSRRRSHVLGRGCGVDRAGIWGGWRGSSP